MSDVALVNVAENFKGGKVFQYRSRWESFSSDKQFLKFVEGNVISFDSLPVQDCIPWPLRFSVEEQSALDVAMSQYILKEIVELCPPTSRRAYYSNIFPVLKPNGTARLILNLKGFNPYVTYEHFKMDTLSDVIQMISPLCFFASLDLKDAYFSVLVRPEDRDWFRFLWQDRHYRFRCMPQGFASAPRVFTKLLKPIMAHFRSHGMMVSCYIDDCILMAQSAEVLAKDVQYALSVFDSLGLTVNVEKSSMVPSRVIEFLGFVLDSEVMSVTLMEVKQVKIRELGGVLVRRGKFPITVGCWRHS